MNKSVMVIAPHPDDESLGCGGTLLRHKSEGDDIHWCVVTDMQQSSNYTSEQKAQRAELVEKVSQHFGFSSERNLGFTPAGLDSTTTGALIEKLKEYIDLVKPHTVYIPYAFDVHSDHRYVFDAVISVSKSFRAPYIKKVACYETLSETDFGLSPINTQFQPNLFVDISYFSEQKKTVLSLYQSELDAHPFPRSFDAVEALEIIRGTQAHVERAEAFVVLKEIA